MSEKYYCIYCGETIDEYNLHDDDNDCPKCGEANSLEEAKLCPICKETAINYGHYSCCNDCFKNLVDCLPPEVFVKFIEVYEIPQNFDIKDSFYKTIFNDYQIYEALAKGFVATFNDNWNELSDVVRTNLYLYDFVSSSICHRDVNEFTSLLRKCECESCIPSFSFYKKWFTPKELYSWLAKAYLEYAQLVPEMDNVLRTDYIAFDDIPIEADKFATEYYKQLNSCTDKENFKFKIDEILSNKIQEAKWIV